MTTVTSLQGIHLIKERNQVSDGVVSLGYNMELPERMEKCLKLELLVCQRPGFLTTSIPSTLTMALHGRRRGVPGLPRHSPGTNQQQFPQKLRCNELGWEAAR